MLFVENNNSNNKQKFSENSRGWGYTLLRLEKKLFISFYFSFILRMGLLTALDGLVYWSVIKKFD